MQQLRDNFTANNQLHHAYVLEADGELGGAELITFFGEQVGIKTRGNPNFLHEVRDTFLIEDARRLRELQLNKTAAGERKVFIISFNFITREAQNALLKVLEEPTDGTHIFLITPTKHILLPTVLSRIVLLRLDGQHDQVLGETFIELSYKDRMKEVTKLVKNIKDEKKSKADAIALVQSIIQILHTKMQTVSADMKLEMGSKIKQLEHTKRYLYDQGASVKMLLEHVALTV